MMHTPIPKLESPGTYTKARFTDSPLVRLEPDRHIEIRMQYPTKRMKHAEPECLVRKEIPDMLHKAAKYLPPGYRFCVWDAWRPFALQQELYDACAERIIRQFGLQDAPEEEQKDAVLDFVSEPLPDEFCPPVHTTGGAIDLTVLDNRGYPLDMGTGFDNFTDMAFTAYFEQTGPIQVRDNRRLLYHAMRLAGFTNLPSEWWHYDYGDRFWAYYQKQPAFYSGIFRKPGTQA